MVVFGVLVTAQSQTILNSLEAVYLAGKMCDVIGEAKVLVKNYTYVADRKGWRECVSRCRVKVIGVDFGGQPLHVPQ